MAVVVCELGVVDVGGVGGGSAGGVLGGAGTLNPKP